MGELACTGRRERAVAGQEVLAELSESLLLERGAERGGRLRLAGTAWRLYGNVLRLPSLIRRNNDAVAAVNWRRGVGPRRRRRRQLPAVGCGGIPFNGCGRSPAVRAQGGRWGPELLFGMRELAGVGGRVRAVAGHVVLAQARFEAARTGAVNAARRRTKLLNRVRELAPTDSCEGTLGE